MEIPEENSPGQDGAAGKRPTLRTERYWLCAVCSRMYTLAMEPGGAVLLLALDQLPPADKAA